MPAARAQGEAAPAQAAPPAAPDEPVIEMLAVAGSRLELQFDGRFDAALRLRARAWAEAAAGAVAGYLGRFPLPAVEVLLQAVPGAGVRGGTTFGEPEPYVRLRLGLETRADQFADDWVLVHEMLHLALPRLPRRHAWLHEGWATYAEGIARARAGLLPLPVLWRAMVTDMPQGQPGAGDAGLDHTPTWARTYWGGAIFCLLADVQLRRRSGGRVGLAQAMRGVMDAGGSYAVAWPIGRILGVADASVGQTTLTELYALLKDCPAPVDLAALWQDLGVELGPGDGVQLRADAPLAGLRRAIAG